MTFGRLKDLVFSRIFRRQPRPATLLEYWEKRAREFGPRAVLDMRHAPEEEEAVTREQQRRLFPLLTQQLTGAERTVLDFGCGPGRFTGPLADLIGGQAIGIDPIQRFLDLAPAHPRVEYRLLKNGQIPLAEGAADVVWVCLVLGGVPHGDLPAAAAEIRRVLKAGGLLFLAENTQEGVSSPHWTSRSIEEYQALFPFLSLGHLDDYHDLGQRVSIFAGRKAIS
jgi:SAM-dependent methyltransferase